LGNGVKTEYTISDFKWANLFEAIRQEIATIAAAPKSAPGLPEA
jgi:hypothetical protein